MADPRYVFTMTTTSTIFALSSAPGRAAVAVIRVSGPAARSVLESLSGKVPEPRRATLATLRDPDTGTPLDQGLILFFAAPSSETGEDVAELQTHGGRAVLAAVLKVLSALPGCRMAEPGEFARRAFANGKLDLTTAEGIADLVDAETEAQRRQALTQASGALGRLYEDWRNRLIEASALVEAAIDFSDEPDVSDKAVAQAEGVARRLETELTAHLTDDNRGEILREGFRIVLAGPPNAGKSSLINALARRDVAIVSEEAGTTRDIIEVHLDLAGLPVIVTDTAGIRDAVGAVEREGIRRTFDRARSADLVIWLSDATTANVAPPAELDGMRDRLLLVVNKIDALGDIITTDTLDGIIPISALTGVGLPALTERLAAIASSRIGNVGTAPLITQARHRAQVESAVKALRAFGMGSPQDLELRAEDLRAASTALGRITGRIDVEDVLDQIFGRFCIGK
jgi:tRNA modification GTPase